MIHDSRCTEFFSVDIYFNSPSVVVPTGYLRVELLGQQLIAYTGTQPAFLAYSISGRQIAVP
jgi:hypothetical protein